MPKNNQNQLDIRNASKVMTALRERLIKLNPERALGLAGCLMLAGRTVATVSIDKEDFEETLAAAVQLLQDRARADFTARQKSARRGRRTATTH